MTEALALRNVRAAYGPAEVLFDISLTCAPREVVGLLGRNGAGKTTTLLAILGLGLRVSGSSACFGQELAGLSTDARARAGPSRQLESTAWIPPHYSNK